MDTTEVIGSKFDLDQAVVEALARAYLDPENVSELSDWSETEELCASEVC